MKKQSRRKILLIDDDPSLLITLSDFLSFEGYEVSTADSGEQGLEILDSVDPDLVILDMSMPGMGGMGFLREISGGTGKPSHPVLVLTARANMAEFFADMEVDGFIAKPCDPADLLMEVGRIVFLRSGPGEEGEGQPGSGAKILLAEDDGGRNQVIKGAFEKSGFEVCSVTKGPDVLEKAIIEKPDVVVLKLVLASMNGDAIAEVLKGMPNTRDIPVVLYDDSDMEIPEDKFESINNVKKFVRGNDPSDIIGAVQETLA